MHKFSPGFETLRGKLIASILPLLMLVLAAVAALGTKRLGDRIDEDLDIRTKTQLRVAVRIFAEYASVFQTEKDEAGEPVRLRVRDGSTLLSLIGEREGTQIVDAISEANRGTATFFRYDRTKEDFVRLATTVKKPDGSRAVGTVLGKTSAAYPLMMRGDVFRGIAQILGDPYQTGYVPFVDPAGKPLGILYIGVGKLADLAAAKDNFMREMLVGSLVVLAISALLLMVITARLTRPLAEVARATEELAGGTIGVLIPHCGRRDEVGTLARAVDGFKSTVERQQGLERQGAEEARALASRKREMDVVVSEFRSTVSEVISRLQGGVSSVRRTAQSIQQVVAQTRDCANEGSGAASNGATAIAEVAGATHQFSTSITEIAARSNEAAHVVRNASAIGQNAEAVAGELTQAVDKIAAAVAFISGIAAQTNLLALNATIEAARAGEAGKGFAVVASEVKELSSGTSRAATEIADMVKSIQDVTRAVTDATRQIGQGLGAINDTTQVIATAVSEQEEVIRDIAVNADSAAKRSDVVLSGFETIRQAIENTSSEANSLDRIAEEFSTSSDHLINEIEGFLKRMAA